MYFIDEQHEFNLKEAQLRWPSAQRSPEYAAACYILAIPMIFEKVVDDIGRWDSPVSWIYEWEEKYGPLPIDGAKKPDFDLSSSMVQLGRLSL